MSGVSILENSGPTPILRLTKFHRIIDDRMENSVNGKRIQYNLR